MKEEYKKYFEIFIIIALVILLVFVIRFGRVPVIGKGFTVIQSDYITATINLPSEVYVNEEFLVVIDLDVRDNVDNGILVSVDIPPGLDVNSVNPSNAVITKDKLAWILSPHYYNLSFKIITNISKEYELNIKFRTYINQMIEENNKIVILNVMERSECEENNDCDDGNVCTSDICINNECNFIEIDGCCLNNSECEDHNTCTINLCVNDVCLYEPVDCEDGDVNTEDVCMYKRKCIHFRIGGCVNNTECDDSDDCTIDACMSGECVYNQIQCEPDYICENGECVIFDPCEGVVCDSGYFCELGDCMLDCGSNICDCSICPQNCGPTDCGGEPI